MGGGLAIYLKNFQLALFFFPRVTGSKTIIAPRFGRHWEVDCWRSLPCGCATRLRDRPIGRA